MKEHKATTPERMPSSERRVQIIDAAARILATKGARRFTVQLLASEIGITGGAIYRHFESMDAIVDAVVEQIGALLFEGFPPAAQDPLERLGLFFRHRTKILAANPQLSVLLHSEHLAQAAGPAQAKRLDAFKERSQSFVRSCLLEAQRNGALSEELSPDAGAIIVLGSILRLSRNGSRRAIASEVDRLSGEVWSAIARGLRPADVPRRVTHPRRRRHRTEREV